jgi:hypothetical protein
MRGAASMQQWMLLAASAARRLRLACPRATALGARVGNAAGLGRQADQREAGAGYSGGGAGGAGAALWLRLMRRANIRLVTAISHEAKLQLFPTLSAVKAESAIGRPGSNGAHDPQRPWRTMIPGCEPALGRHQADESPIQRRLTPVVARISRQGDSLFVQEPARTKGHRT